MLEVDSNRLYCSIRPNRSLTVRGRRLWLALIAMNASVIALAALMVGAWPVVPFAGLEIALVALAFAVIGRHDADVEWLKLELDGGQFCWEQRVGKHVSSLAGNSAWVQLQVRSQKANCEISLRYQGSQVLVGAGLPEEQRQVLAQQLRLYFGAHTVIYCGSDS